MKLIDHGFYEISRKLAIKLAKDARKRVPAREKLAHLRDPEDRTMLPSPGFELRVEYKGEPWWLTETIHNKKMVWSLVDYRARMA